MVLTGSALLVKSLLRARHEDPGFRSKGVLTFLLSLPEDRYKPTERTGTFLTSAVARLGVVPGVVDVPRRQRCPRTCWLSPTATPSKDRHRIPRASTTSLTGTWWTPSISRPADQPRRGTRVRRARPRHVAAVAMVNEAFVRRHYPDGRALGKRLKGGTSILRRRGPPSSASFGTWRMSPASGAARNRWSTCRTCQNRWYRSPYFAVRTAGDPSQLVPAIRSALGEIDPRLPLRDVITLDDEVTRRRLCLACAEDCLPPWVCSRSLWPRRALRRDGVSREPPTPRHGDSAGARREREAGADIDARHGPPHVAAGVAIGTVAALATARSLSSMLYRVDPHDPTVLVTAVCVVMFRRSWRVSCRRFASHRSILRRCCGMNDGSSQDRTSFRPGTARLKLRPTAAGTLHPAPCDPISSS